MPLTSSHNSKLKTSPLFDSYFTHFDLCEYKIIRQYVHLKKKNMFQNLVLFFCLYQVAICYLKSTNTHIENIFLYL